MTLSKEELSGLAGAHAMTEREVSSERVSEERLERILDNARHEFLAADTQVMCQYWQDRIDIYTELLALRSSVKTVGVKKLEWSIEQRSGFNIHVGRGLGLKYEAAIKAYNPGWIVTLGESDVIFDGTDVGEEEAKAAAQADYESRVLSALARPAPQEAPSEVTDIMVQKAWEAYDANGGYSKPERFRAAIIAAMKGRSPMTVETEGQYGSFTPISVGVGTSALNSEGLEKAVAQAIFDPGATEGYKGDRTLTEWQVQAVMRAITYHTPALPPVDGLEVVAWDVAPKGLPAEPTKSHSFVAEIERQGGSITPLTRLSQASSVIAGLKEANEALTGTAEVVRNNIPMEYLRRHDVPGATGPTRALDIASAMRDYAEDRWKLIDRLKATEARISSLEEENKRLREALTPSGDTKAAYAGEFFERVEIVNPMFEGYEDDEPETIMQRFPVSWTTIKEIMATIQAYARTEDHNG